VAALTHAHFRPLCNCVLSPAGTIWVVHSPQRHWWTSSSSCYGRRRQQAATGPCVQGKYPVDSAGHALVLRNHLADRELLTHALQYLGYKVAGLMSSFELFHPAVVKEWAVRNHPAVVIALQFRAGQQLACFRSCVTYSREPSRGTGSATVCGCMFSPAYLFCSTAEDMVSGSSA
jgi:hypothetical protein